MKYLVNYLILLIAFVSVCVCVSNEYITGWPPSAPDFSEDKWEGWTVQQPTSIENVPTPTTKVQISPTQEEGKWINVRALVVEWNESLVDNVSPHNPIDADLLQEWFIAFKGKWYGFSFTRSTPGKYAIRVSFGGHFGGWGVCEKILPPAPIHP